ncbi:MAG: UDP-N-acetylmuramate dehydrogenase [Oscillospiraceae bacterium]|jgi:UDP-N-acetylmuramate dehydrogenase|nr:UDP-N-acetylmuramate dehydrogenase [Oscillospiraceae bacterium]
MTNKNYDFSVIKAVAESFGAKFVVDELLAPYTSFKIGGVAAAMLAVNSEDCLVHAVKAARENSLPFRVMGKGTNLLVSDDGLNALVILVRGAFSAVTLIGEETIRAEAGASLSDLCKFARDNSLTGAEWAFGIPGTIGGAVYMNAGAYGSETADILSAVRFIGDSGEIETVAAQKCGFGYRDSVFKHSGGILLSAEFSLKKGEKFRVDSRMNEIIAQRKLKQPLDYPNAGSTFKRPSGDYASRLIDTCGLKGLTVGGAAVSDKHAGFVISKNNATFADVTALVAEVRRRVKEQTGVELEEEIEIWAD